MTIFYREALERGMFQRERLRANRSRANVFEREYVAARTPIQREYVAERTPI